MFKTVKNNRVVYIKALHTSLPYLEQIYGNVERVKADETRAIKNNNRIVPIDYTVLINGQIMCVIDYVYSELKQLFSNNYTDTMRIEVEKNLKESARQMRITQLGIAELYFDCKVTIDKTIDSLRVIIDKLQLNSVVKDNQKLNDLFNELCLMFNK